jgi:hypothetical protein
VLPWICITKFVAYRHGIGESAAGSAPIITERDCIPSPHQRVYLRMITDISGGWEDEGKDWEELSNDNGSNVS